MLPASLWLRTGLSCGMDFIYPRSCRWCRCLLSEESDRWTRFCPGCTRVIAPLIQNRCSRCSAPVGPNLNSSSGCLHCRRAAWHFQDVISLGPYQDELRQACLRCKHSRHPALITALADLLCQRSEQALCNWGCDVVIPVPHFWIHRIVRNHSSLAIAERISGFLRQPLDRFSLCKVRLTRRQQELSATAREKNLNNAFRVVRGARLKGKRVLLVDDVLTTGVTADRCTRVLLNAGAAEVHVVVLARSISG